MRMKPWFGCALGVGAGLLAGTALAAPGGASAATGDPVRLGQKNTAAAQTVVRGPYDEPPAFDDVLWWDKAEQYAPGTTTENGLGTDFFTADGVWSKYVTAKEIQGDHLLATSRFSKYDPQPALLAQGTPHARGAVLSGGPAQLKLTPSGQSGHPTSGERGDLFVDRSGRLWYCKGGKSWKQLA